MNFTIRQLIASDLSDSSGFIETMANMHDISHLTLAQLKDFWQKASQPGVYFLLAISQEEASRDQIVATAKLLVEPKFFHEGRPAGHIEDVVTRQGFEGNGLAKALLGEAIRIARDNNCYKVILDCKKELVDFYSKVGFKEHDVCMRIDLN